MAALRPRGLAVPNGGQRTSPLTSFIARIEGALSRVPPIRWAASVTVVYVVWVGFLLLRHSLWRDEAQLWLVARGIRSVDSLVTNIQNEAHHALWVMMVWPVTYVSSNPEAIKLLTLAFSGATAYLVCRWTPLYRLEQVGLLSGLLLATGYSVVSTGYIVGIFLIFAWVAAYASQRSLALTLLTPGLLALSHFLFLVIAFPLLLISLNRCRASAAWGVIQTRNKLLALTTVSLGLFGIAVLLNLPDEAGGFVVDATAVDLGSRIGNVLFPLQQAIFPFTRVLDNQVFVADGTRIALIVAFQLLALLLTVSVCYPALRLSPRYTLFPVLSALLLLANAVFFYAPYWWHSGVLFFSLLMIVVVSRMSARLSWFSVGLRGQTVALWILLAAQSISLLSPGKSMMGFQPFSNAKSAAMTLQELCLRPCRLVTDWDYLSTGVSAYLGAEDIYSVNAHRAGTFTLWSADERRGKRVIGWEEIRRAMRERGPGAIGVLSEARNPPSDFITLSTTTGSIWGEDFIIVKLR